MVHGRTAPTRSRLEYRSDRTVWSGGAKAGATTLSGRSWLAMLELVVVARHGWCHFVWYMYMHFFSLDVECLFGVW